ncbi:hypothetical protein LT493_33930 [Streptomyces tricolor]|nr:hypothetical protein [Streptomyces tricolor]
MSTTPGRPSPSPLTLPVPALPAASVPDGCLAWSGEHARRWLDALPPRWVPLPSRTRHLLTALSAAVAVAGLLALLAGWHPWAAALLALHGLWLCARPEIVPVSAPALAVLLAVLRPGTTWPETAVAGAVLAAVWAAAVLRLVARRRQRERARDAAGGASAPLPDAGRPLSRGRFLLVCGGVLLALGLGALAVTSAHPPDEAEAARAMPALAWLVAGQGLTTLVSGLLGRRRAGALRAAPAPVLRVLVREGADGDTEVFAADDTAALRPLFRVAVTEIRDADAAEGDDGEDEDDDEDDEEELEEFLARMDREGRGRCGRPCCTACPGTAPRSCWSRPPRRRTGSRCWNGRRDPYDRCPRRRYGGRGPGRSAGRAGRRRTRSCAGRPGEAVAREAKAEAETGTDGAGRAGVRHWRAGLLDRLCALLLLLWGSSLFWGEAGGWHYVLGIVAGFIEALWLPHWFAWRITADREGLWLNGLRGPRQLLWEDISVVACEGTELKLDSRRASFTGWSAHTPRWPWLERRFGLLHPYERDRRRDHRPVARPRAAPVRVRRPRGAGPAAVAPGTGAGGRLDGGPGVPCREVSGCRAGPGLRLFRPRGRAGREAVRAVQSGPP